ncbi:Hypothetical predicted protein [Octopus vulgaris]|uniref:Uncharacterized protein n=1 Tax=Octopus vulgaris TaxID=6645 RepID=A0AA36BWD6_OCTVU|nr:Hypothetical predicted protein [Octopus vulgaris]
MMTTTDLQWKNSPRVVEGKEIVERHGGGGDGSSSRAGGEGGSGSGGGDVSVGNNWSWLRQCLSFFIPSTDCVIDSFTS